MVAWPVARRGQRGPGQAAGLREGRADGAPFEAQRVDERGLRRRATANHWLNAVMNSVADGIVLLDPEGTINWLSRSAETIFDYPRDAAVGASIDLLLPLPAEHGGSLLDRLQGAAAGRRAAGAHASAGGPANCCRWRSRAASSSSATGG